MEGNNEGQQKNNVNNESVQQQNQQQQNTAQGQTAAQNVDVEEEKKKAVQDLLKGIGVEDSETLKGIVESHKKAEESKLTDIEKKEAEITKLTKELVEERERRIVAEAKVEGIRLGANPDLVDDLVIVAKSRVTKDKDVGKIMSEMKEAGAVYFKTEEEENAVSKKKKIKNVTTQSSGTKQEPEGGQGSDALMERILKKKNKMQKSPYFS